MRARSLASLGMTSYFPTHLPVPATSSILCSSCDSSGGAAEQPRSWRMVLVSPSRTALVITVGKSVAYIPHAGASITYASASPK